MRRRPGFLGAAITGMPTIEIVTVAAVLALSVFLLLGGLITSWATGAGLLNAAGMAVGRDFVMFWSAASLTLGGNAVSVYDFETLHQIQGNLVGAPDLPLVAWLYPPTGLLLVAPFGLLPYRAALALWSLLGLGGLGLVLWHIVRHWRAVAVLLLFPAVSLCLVNGQSGVYLAVLLGGALVLLDRRPGAAGLLLAVASIKPQLLLLVGPVLILGRHWRALAALLGGFATLTLVSLALFGAGPWQAFYDVVLTGVHILDQVHPLERMPSVFVAVWLLGASPDVATFFQVGMAALMLVVVGRLWLRRAPMALRGSALLFAAPLATPYSFDYDLAVLTVAFAWLALDVMHRGWRTGEKLLLLAVWISPIGAWLLARETGVQIMPLILLGCVAATVRRTARDRRPESGPETYAPAAAGEAE